MNRSIEKMIAAFGFVCSLSVAIAQPQDSTEEAQDAKYDAIAAGCEAKFTADKYPDEDDRYTKIDRCIEDGLNKASDAEAGTRG